MMRVLFIGMGSIGTIHYYCLKNLKERYSLEFISYKTDLNKDNIKLEEDIKYYECLDEALAAKPDCAIISNPTSIHIDTAIKCASQNVHLFIEKPLSNSTKNIDKLINVVGENKLISLVGCNLRFHPALIELKDIIEAEEMGRLYDFNISTGSYLPEWRPWQDYTKSYSAKRELGGGVTLDLIHEIDYSYWLFGEFEKLYSITAKASKLQIETEDVAKIIVETKNKYVGNISINYYRRFPERVISINCEKGCITLDLIANKMDIQSLYYSTLKCYNIDKFFTYEKQMQYFIESVTRKADTNNNILEGLKVLEYALAAKRGGLTL